MFGCGGAPVQSEAPVSGNVPAGAIVLRIEVIERSYTGLSPADDCPKEEPCIQFQGWSKYRARVREVISGNWNKKDVTFARLEHGAYMDKVTRDCYVILDPANADIRSKIGVQFVSRKLLSNIIESHRAEIEALGKTP